MLTGSIIIMWRKESIFFSQNWEQKNVRTRFLDTNFAFITITPNLFNQNITVFKIK